MWHLLAAILIGFVYYGGPAAADDKLVNLLPRADPPGHARVLTLRDETSTSKCIGRMETPLCAVETKIACVLRLDPSLCRTAYWPDAPFEWVPPPDEYAESRFIKYRVRLARYARDSDIPLVVRGLPDGPRAGDVMLQVGKLTCGCCGCVGSFGPPFTYFVRRADGRWRLVDWYRRLGPYEYRDPQYARMRMQHLSIVAGLVAAFAVARTPAARGQDIPLPPVDPPEHWNVIKQDDVRDPESCVGSAVSPQCMLKTDFACRLLSQRQPCEVQWWPKDIPEWHLQDIANSSVRPGDYVKYRIIGARRARARDIPEGVWAAEEKYRPRAGDVLLLVYAEPCFGDSDDDDCGGDDGAPEFHYFRLVDGRWHHVTMYIPRY